MEQNLVKKVITGGGSLIPLLIPSEASLGLGLMNPSILHYKGDLIVNIRSINYTLWHNEGEQRFYNRWGPLVYLNPENDVKLKTRNFITILDNNFFVKTHCLVDTSKLDIPPVWDFHGLEDARLVEWEGKLYLCGVRRDLQPPDGRGRMELSEIKFSNYHVKEVSRFRIPAPGNDNMYCPEHWNPSCSWPYCEKNWLPITDWPYHFVKWMNPLEIVKVDPKEGTCVTVNEVGAHDPTYAYAFRGSSQVIPYGTNYRICVLHETHPFSSRLEQKDAQYVHRFIVWDRDWNLIHVSEPFSFMTGMIEFCCGMVFHEGEMLITFSFQDNAAYLLRIPSGMINDIVGVTRTGIKNQAI